MTVTQSPSPPGASRYGRLAPYVLAGTLVLLVGVVAVQLTSGSAAAPAASPSAAAGGSAGPADASSPTTGAASGICVGTCPSGTGPDPSGLATAAASAPGPAAGAAASEVASGPSIPAATPGPTASTTGSPAAATGPGVTPAVTTPAATVRPTQHPSPAATPTPTLRPTPIPTRAPTPAPTATPPPAGGELAGTWRTTSGTAVAATVSAGVGPFQSEVVARTGAVDGTADVAANAGGYLLSGSQFTADTRQLTTGDGNLDGQMYSILETDRYPTSHFEQTGTAGMPATDQLRSGAQITLRGNLTLHGVTRAVVVPAQVTYSGGAITVVAAIAFRTADYDIHGSGLVSVGDAGTISFRLVMTR